MAPATPKPAALIIAAELAEACCVKVETAPELVELQAQVIMLPSAVKSRMTLTSKLPRRNCQARW